jgi:Leucine-rich repeat (LRR) protein
LPDTVCNITSLHNLQLQYTNISSLPPSIGSLINLEYLGIYSYRNGMFSDDDDSVPYYGQDKKTEKRSQFTVLPAEISKLASLRFLVISNTEVTSLPDYLGYLPVLEKIIAVNCNIKTIPSSLQRLIDREELFLFRTKKEFDDDSDELFRKRPKRR